MKLQTYSGALGCARRIYDCPELLRGELEFLLTYDNPAFATVKRFSPWENTKVPEKICLAEDFVSFTQLPRGFVPDRLTPAARRQWDLIRWQDDRTEFNVKFPQQKLTANADQEYVMRVFLRMQKLRQRPGGTYLFVVPTSGGKTISQAMLAAQTGQRTLVLCKTNLIKRAWQENLYALFGMNEDDLGEIQQKSYRIGEHFTLASIATLSRRKALWHEIFSQVGCLIIDEAQIIGASTIQEICAACPSKYVIGMTATERRRDGQTFLVNAVLGPVALRIHNKQAETQSSLPLSSARVVKTAYRYLDAAGNPVARDLLDFAALTTQMSRDPVRNALIVEEVYRDWAAGHSVLVSTPRIEHASLLLELLHKRGVDDANLLTGETNSKRFYTDKLIESVMSRECRCVVASKEAVKLGANLNPLDRLHVAIPPANKDDLEQLIGRIRRKDPSKKDAELIYYHDILTPYWHSKFKKSFVPVMRKLKVPKWMNIFIA